MFIGGLFGFTEVIFRLTEVEIDIRVYFWLNLCYNRGMKLEKRADKFMFFATVFMLAFVFGVTMAKNMMVDTFAETEEGIYEEQEEHFVTFYDDGGKLTIKTTAKTVKEALDKVG